MAEGPRAVDAIVEHHEVEAVPTAPVEGGALGIVRLLVKFAAGLFVDRSLAVVERIGFALERLRGGGRAGAEERQSQALRIWYSRTGPSPHAAPPKGKAILV